MARQKPLRRRAVCILWPWINDSFGAAPEAHVAFSLGGIYPCFCKSPLPCNAAAFLPKPLLCKSLRMRQ